MSANSKIYSNAVAKFLEGKLLDADKFKRLSGADYNDAVKMLIDYGYGDGTAYEGIDTDELINAETNALIVFADEYAPAKSIFDALTAKYFYNSVKAAYKEKVSGISAKGAAADFFMKTVDEVKSGDYSDLPDELSVLLEELDEQNLDNPLNSRTIDESITSAMYASCLKNSKKIGSTGYKKYVLAEIDGRNMLAAFRAVRAGVDLNIFNEMILSGGKITSEEFAVLFDKGSDAFLRVIDDDNYDTAKLLSESTDFSSFERDLDEYLFSLTVAGRENMTKSDPFINYFLAKESELKTVKILLTCIKNGLTAEIDGRIRRTYE